MSDASDSKPDNGEEAMAERQAAESVDGVDGAETDTLSRSSSSASPAQAVRAAARWPAWLALLLSIVALALAAGSYWIASDEPSTDPDPALAALESRLEVLQRSIRQTADQAANAVDAEVVGQLESRIASAEQAAAAPDRQIAGLQQRLDRTESELDRRLEGVRQQIAEAEQSNRSRLDRLEQLEQQLSAEQPKPGMSSERSNAEQAALMRIEGLLLAAGDRLELLGDVQAARNAWAEAIARVERLDSPEFEALLQRLRAERDALTAVSSRDDAAEISALFAAANDVLLWPERAETGRATTDSEEIASRADSGWKARFDRVFNRLVRVERVEIQYLDPAELDAARRSLAALLEATALSVARRDDEVTARLASEAQRRIRELFETSQPAITALIQRLGTLASPQAAPELRLEASMAELRRLIEDGR